MKFPWPIVIRNFNVGINPSIRQVVNIIEWIVIISGANYDWWNSNALRTTAINCITTRTVVLWSGRTEAWVWSASIAPKGRLLLMLSVSYLAYQLSVYICDVAMYLDRSSYRVSGSYNGGFMESRCNVCLYGKDTKVNLFEAKRKLPKSE